MKNATITIKRTMNFTCCRPIIPVSNTDRDGVLLVDVQYLNGDQWENTTMPRAILQDLANYQANYQATRERNEKLIDRLIAAEKVVEAALKVGLPAQADNADGWKALGTALADYNIVRNS